MIYMLDTANLEDIRQVNDRYPIAGVTTNPTIIAAEKRPFLDIVRDIREIIGEEKMLHVQVLATRAEDMIEEALYLKSQIGGNLYIKVPVIPEGIKAIRKLSEMGINTTATACCSAPQALMAATAGAKFVAPYINRADDTNVDGVALVEDIQKLFAISKLDTKVLAASFKNVRQVHEVTLAGAESITIQKDLMDRLLKNALTDWSVNRFIEDWKSVYGTERLIQD